MIDLHDWVFQPNPSVVVARGTAPGQIRAMTNPKIRIRENFPAAPVCPHCGKEIHGVTHDSKSKCSEN